MSLNKKKRFSGKTLLILLSTFLMLVVTIASPLIYVTSNSDNEVINETSEEIENTDTFSFADTAKQETDN